MFDLTHKTAVVTGGASGIGAAIAQRLRAAGAAVAVFDVSDSESRLGGVSYHAVDVSDADAFAAALDTVLATTGRLDVLVNNAAIQPLGPTLAQTTPELLEQTLRVNLHGTLHGLRLAAERMPEGGRIINLGSFIALRAAPKASAYGLSKSAILYATRVAAIELAPRRITVNCICPGTVNTPAVTAIRDNPEPAWVKRVTPMGRMAEPSEVAAAVHFLASEEAGFITGQALAVDGGATAGWSDHDVIPPPQLQNGQWVGTVPATAAGGAL
ncbi:MAG: SDR family NAD(P)-dependent oxidoreductase [Phycisphaeraceae bacterium]